MISSEIFLIIFLSPIFLLLLLILIKQYTKKVTMEAVKLPPGPKRLPLIGNLHQLLLGSSLPHRSLERLSRDHGPLMLLQLGSVPTLVVSSADAARQIFKNHDIVFSSRPAPYAAKIFSYNCNSMSFAPYGHHWREVRKIAVLELFSAKRVQSFEVVRDEEAGSMIDSITNYASENLQINLSELATLLANNVIFRTVFGQKSDDGSGVGNNGWGKGKSKFHGILQETQHLLGGFCVADFFPWMEWLLIKLNGIETRVDKNFRELDRLYDAILEDHLDPNKPKSQHEDFVHVLLRIQKDPNQAITLTNDQIKGVLTEMFIAGSDTSSATLVWTMAELMRHPMVMKKAQDEVRKTVEGKTKIDESQISKLVYLKLVIKESLRLHPPAPLLLPRETTERCVVAGYEIPAKTRVFVNVKTIATDPTFWENPYEFWPERFLGDNSSIDFRGQSFELLPFGAGRRGCPGMNFALPLVELALANLLYCFDWSLPEGMQVEDIDMEEEFGLTMHKKIPLVLVATPANHVH